MRTDIARLCRKAGFPDPAGRGKALGATLIDTFGGGAFTPLALLFFTGYSGLELAEAGFGVSLGTMLAFPLAPVAGAIVDRIGARNVLVLSNVVTGLGYLSYLLVHDVTTLVCAVFVVMAGDRLYEPAWLVFVGEIAEERDLDRWFALVSAARCAGQGVGVMAGTVLLSTGLPFAALLAANVVSYGTSAVLLGSQQTLRRPEPRAGAAAGRHFGTVPRTGFRQMAGDRTFRALAVAQGLMIFAWVIPNSLVAVYFIRTLDLPQWTAGAAVGLNLLITVLFQTTVTRYTAGYPRNRIAAASAMFMVAAVVVLSAAAVTPRALAAVPAGLAVLLFTIGQMCFGPAVNALAMTTTPEASRGRYLSVLQLNWSIVLGCLGPLLVGLLDVQPLLMWVLLVAAISVGGYGFLRLERVVPAERLLAGSLGRPEPADLPA